MGFSMDDYVDVAERIREFYERFPNGSLRTGEAPSLMFVGERSFIAYHAQAFRTPDDPCPADGWAWEPVPGPTQFTKDSELQNAETAAWGRAIVALGFQTKKIASKQEVRNRQPEPTKPANSTESTITDAQQKRLWAIAKSHGVTNDRVKQILFEAGPWDHTYEIPKDRYDEIVSSLELDEVPFA